MHKNIKHGMQHIKLGTSYMHCLHWPHKFLQTALHRSCCDCASVTPQKGQGLLCCIQCCDHEVRITIMLCNRIQQKFLSEVWLIYFSLSNWVVTIAQKYLINQTNIQNQHNLAVEYYMYFNKPLTVCTSYLCNVDQCFE